jgi:hypothetical protein
LVIAEQEQHLYANLSPGTIILIFSGIDREYGCDIPFGWLSIDRAFNGRAVYKIEGWRITLDDSGYLIRRKEPNTRSHFGRRVMALS